MKENNEAPVSELVGVKGVGGQTAGKLAAIGVTSVAGLAAADLKRLVAGAGLHPGTARRLITAARAQLESSGGSAEFTAVAEKAAHPIESSPEVGEPEEKAAPEEGKKKKKKKRDRKKRAKEKRKEKKREKRKKAKKKTKKK